MISENKLLNQQTFLDLRLAHTFVFENRKRVKTCLRSKFRFVEFSHDSRIRTGFLNFTNSPSLSNPKRFVNKYRNNLTYIWVNLFHEN